MTLPVLLLPGTLCDTALWAPTLERLGDRPAQVGDLTRDHTIAAMAERVLAAAPPRFAIAGYSLGGVVALEIQRRAPSRVAGLALVCTNPGPDLHPDRESLTKRARVGHFSAIIDEFIASYFTGPPPPVLAKQIEAMALHLGVEVFARQNLALAGRCDSRPLLPNVRAPTLIIRARNDALVRPEIAAQSQAIPGTWLETIEDCGHMLPLERPDTLAGVLDEWLATLEPKSTVAST